MRKKQTYQMPGEKYRVKVNRHHLVADLKIYFEQKANNILGGEWTYDEAFSSHSLHCGARKALLFAKEEEKPLTTTNYTIKEV